MKLHSLLPILSIALLAAGCSDQPEPPRRTQVVKLLPDTPPPPPPPPKPEDRPPPKPEDKPQPQDAPKPVETPQAQALKSDEAAGDGPGNGLSAGSVTQDYTDQKTGQVQTVGGEPGEGAGNTMLAHAFASSTTRMLNEFLVRDREVRRLDYRVRVDLWISPSGALQRAELVGSTGDPQTDEALRMALNRFQGPGNPPPPRLPQPLRLQVSNRMVG